MLAEMDYTLHVNHETTSKLDEHLITSPDPLSAAAGSHAIAVLTEWDEFKTYDFQMIFDSMAKPAFIFDGRNLLDHGVLRKIGFEVYSIGKPTSKYF
jgi:UDPglucose 6-dehydrogenase